MHKRVTYHDIAASEELAVDVHLGKGRPLQQQRHMSPRGLPTNAQGCMSPSGLPTIAQGCMSSVETAAHVTSQQSAKKIRTIEYSLSPDLKASSSRMFTHVNCPEGTSNA